MTFDDLKPAKLSLGFLRRAEKKKPKSPDLIGTLKLQRHTMETFIKQFKDQDSEEIVCCLAGWINTDTEGQFLSVELSPKYLSRRQEPERFDLAEFI
jgi:hypothetical protein